MQDFCKKYVVRNWYAIVVMTIGMCIFAGLFRADQAFLFPGSWSLLLILPGLLYLKQYGMSSLSMVGIAFGAFFILAANDYSINPELGGGIIDSKWTPWLMILVGVGIILENILRPHTMIRK